MRRQSCLVTLDSNYYCHPVVHANDGCGYFPWSPVSTLNDVIQRPDHHSHSLRVPPPWYVLFRLHIYISFIFPTSLGIEYWQYTTPASEETTRACAADGEDPTCSASIPTKGINPAHWTVGLDHIFLYFGTHSNHSILESPPQNHFVCNPRTQSVYTTLVQFWFHKIRFVRPELLRSPWG